MLKPLRYSMTALVCAIVNMGRPPSLYALENLHTRIDLRLLTACLNPSASFLLPFSGIQLKPGIEADLGLAWKLPEHQELFYQITPVWRAKRKEKGIYSNLGYRKNFEASQLGLHLFGDWNTLEPIDYAHTQWGFGIEWNYLQKHRWSLISTGYTWGENHDKPNPSVKSIESVYTFQANLSSIQYRATLHYFLHDKVLIDNPQQIYHRPVQGSFQLGIPLNSWSQRYTPDYQWSLLFEPSYLAATGGKGSEASIKLGIQFSSLCSREKNLDGYGCLRSLVRPTFNPKNSSPIEIKENNTSYAVYPVLPVESSNRKAAREKTDQAISIETAEKIQDFWNNHTFSWYQPTEEGILEMVGTGAVIAKENLKKGPISVKVDGETSDLGTVGEASYVPPEPTIVKHTDGETYQTGNLLTIYSELSILPTKPTEYGLLPLVVQSVRETIPNPSLYLGYNLEKIIAVKTPEGEVELQNWTPRSIIDPILEINGQYYCVNGTTLDAYQTFVLRPCPAAISSLNFVDPSPLFKISITKFENEIPATFDYGPVAILDAKQIENFNAMLCTLKRMCNRPDVCTHFFGVVNQKIESLGALAIQEGKKPYHLLLPEGQTAYAMHAYKTMMALPWRTWIGMFTPTSNVAAYATLGSAHGGNEAMMRFADYVVNTPVALGIFVHEMNHVFSYNHDGGLTYGWADEFQQYIDTYYAPEGLVPQDEDPIPGARAVEKQRYFASYRWTDSTHIEVQFYTSDQAASPLTRLAILSWDESYVPATGTPYAPIFDAQDARPMFKEEAVVQDYSQLPFIEQINDSCLRITLSQPRISHGSSILLFASAVSEPPYALDDSLAIIIYPRLRQIIIPAIDFSIFGWAADDRSGPPHPWNMSSYDAVYMELTEEGYHSLFLDSGNTGHVGRVGEEDVDYSTLAPHQSFLPHARYYKTFSIQSAKERAIALGYTGLGTYPTEPCTQLMSKFACQIMHLPRVLGLDPATQEPCLVEYSGFGTANQLTENDTATFLFLKQ